MILMTIATADTLASLRKLCLAQWQRTFGPDGVQARKTFDSCETGLDTQSHYGSSLHYMSTCLAVDCYQITREITLLRTLHPTYKAAVVRER